MCRKQEWYALYYGETLDRKIKLSDRLSTIAGFIGEGASVADVGTDHGQLPVYLAQNMPGGRIIASDISAGSLDSALNTAEKYGVSEKITFIVTPGLEGIGKSDADTIVISGLGGETIAGILKDATWTKNGAKLILQPQTKTAELCIWLRECGYSLRDAKLVLDNGRHYVVMLVVGGNADSVLEPELELLARLIFNRDPLFTGYLDSIIERTRREVEGMRNSAAPDLLEIAVRLAMYVSLKEQNDKWQA